MLFIWKIFVLYSRVSLLSWGGGPASLALMQRESTTALWLPPGAQSLVPWISPEEFADAVAAGNALPGPIAPQVSAFIGYKLAGVPGAIAAAAGSVLPTTLLMLIMVVYFYKVRESGMVKAMLQAVRPVVVGLLLWTAYDMALTVFGVPKYGLSGALTLGWDKLLIVIVAFLVLTFTRTNPAVIILGAATLGAIVYR